MIWLLTRNKTKQKFVIKPNEFILIELVLNNINCKNKIIEPRRKKVV